MIKYSSYSRTNYRTNPSPPAKLPSSLEIEYRELQDLRERVRKAEALLQRAGRAAGGDSPEIVTKCAAVNFFSFRRPNVAPNDPTGERPPPGEEDTSDTSQTLQRHGRIIPK